MFVWQCWTRAPEPMVVTHQYMTPKQWKLFQKNGAPTLFKTILDMMTPTRCHTRAETTTKTDEAKKHSVVVIHLLAYSQSERCNWLQRDLANFLHYHGLSDIGMRAIHQMGLSVGMTAFYTGVHSSSKRHQARLQKIIQETMEKKINGCNYRRLHQYSYTEAL